MYGILLPSCYLDLLDKLQKQICRIVGPSLANPWLIIEMWLCQVFSIGINLVNVLQKWLNWFHFHFLEGGLLVILIDCMIFLSPFVDVTRMSMSTVQLTLEFSASCNSMPVSGCSALHGVNPN